MYRGMLNYWETRLDRLRLCKRHKPNNPDADPYYLFSENLEFWVKQLARCAICDYLEGHGNELIDTQTSARKVRWRPQYNEFQCTICNHEVIEISSEFKRKDYEQQAHPSKAAMPPLSE